MSLTENLQAGEAETERVRIYEFVNYIIHLFDVALFCNTNKTVKGRYVSHRKNIKQVNLKQNGSEFTNS